MGTDEAGIIHGWLDRLAAQYAEEPHRAAIAAAREEYFTRSGNVFEDDAELFDARAASFLEWYVIERPLEDGPPPAVRALEKVAQDPAAADASRALLRIATSHRSLFDVTETDGSSLRLEDVLGGARFSVIERRSTIGFEAGDLVEARLLWDGAQVIFGKTFLFHPHDAREEALDAVDAAMARGESLDEILFSLARRHVRWHRHGYVNAARIYKGVGGG